MSTASNDLSGTIPSEMGQLTAVTELWLCKYLMLQGIQWFGGSIQWLFEGLMLVNCLPPQHSTDLNYISGEIPSEIGELTALTDLILCKYSILQGSNGPEPLQLFPWNHYSCFLGTITVVSWTNVCQLSATTTLHRKK